MKYLPVLFLLLVKTSSSLPFRNLARLGLTSEACSGETAIFAADGDPASCTTTCRKTNPWWKVDLQDIFVIKSITIHNRKDCCAESLDGAEIRVADTLEYSTIVATISHIPLAESKTFTFTKLLEGRYVYVFLTGTDKQLQLCEVEVFGFKRHYDNLALSGEATQISTDTGAHYAIDGERDGFCSRTLPTTNPWWRVDLGATFKIKEIIIANIGYMPEHNLDGAEIHIGNSLDNNGNDNYLASTNVHTAESLVQTFWYRSPLEGRYINVYLPGTSKSLLLCEVEVYGFPMYNLLSLDGEATQIDTYDEHGAASNANDGHRDPVYDHGYCSHTLTTTNPWWRLDLRNTYAVTTVGVTNRGDCCADRLDGAEIRIGSSLENNGNDNTLAVKISHIPSGRTRYFDFSERVEGRYINVYLPGTDKYLTLCEVDVYGYPLNENVAQRGIATQINTDGNGAASNAIDGNYDRNYEHGSCTLTLPSTNPWWRLDLQDTYFITSVTLVNRGDCCADRLDGVEVRIGSSLENNGNDNPLLLKLSYVAESHTKFIIRKPMQGRYINVHLPGTDKMLTLCEVEVYGFQTTG